MDKENPAKTLKNSLSSNRLFEASHIPMLLINPTNQDIIDANQAALSFYGYTSAQILALKISDLNQMDVSGIQHEIALAKLQKRDHFYFTHKLASGELKAVEVHSGPITINGHVFLYSIIHDISARRAAEKLAEELNRDFITLLENTTDFIYFKDKNSRFRFCSQTLAAITGHNSWRDMTGKHDLEVFPPDTAAIYYEEELPIFSEAKPLLNKTDPYYDEQGNSGWVNTNKWPVVDDTGEVVGLFGISRDVTQQYEAEKQQKIANSVFNNVMEGIIVTDPKGLVVEVNDSFCTLSGYSRAEILNKEPRFLKSGHHDSSFFQAMWDSLLNEQHWHGNIWNRHKDGGVFVCRTTITAITDAQGQVANYIGTFSDITTQAREHQAIEKMAYYDALTGLPNRILFEDRLSQSLAQCERSQGKVAICFLDLDKFKPVNDQFGHRAGDQLLKEIATRLEQSIRKGDTVARLGGDEFALVIPILNNLGELDTLLQRILHDCAQPYLLTDDASVSVSASIGVSLYPNDGDNGDHLIHLADQAMYKAKESGANCHCFASEL